LVHRPRDVSQDAVLNSPATTEFARPYMSYGKDERHFDKHIWLLPIPRFDPANGVHKKLAAMAQEAQKLVAGFPVDTELHFAATRRHIREVLEGSAIGNEMNDIVYELLS
jgi:ABC-type Zn2+ transport system substrate-binding protein/surface adhesin